MVRSSASELIRVFLILSIGCDIYCLLKFREKACMQLANFVSVVKEQSKYRQTHEISVALPIFHSWRVLINVEIAISLVGIGEGRIISLGKKNRLAASDTIGFGGEKYEEMLALRQVLWNCWADRSVDRLDQDDI
jgi:hypothetical protein